MSACQASSHIIALALHIPSLCLQVALLFLSRGDMPHEAAWSAWLGAARGLVPLELIEPSTCTKNQSLLPRLSSLPAQQAYKLRRRIFAEQALFSIYVHPSPDFKTYPKDSVFYGHAVRLRVKVWQCHFSTPAVCNLFASSLEA